MLKKLKLALYNKRTTKELENVEFDNFESYGKLPYPIFFAYVNKTRILEPFTPESEEIFKLAIIKLKPSYFKDVTFEDFKIKVATYCEFFHFNEKVIDECLAIYDEKVKTFKSEIKAN